MRRRKLLVVLAGLAVVGAAGAVVLWPKPPSRITQENFDLIRDGMTRAEVEAILGPPGDQRTGLGEMYLQEGPGGPLGLGAGWFPEGEVCGTVWLPDPDDVAFTLSNWSRDSHRGHLCACWMSDSLAMYIAIDDSGRVVFKGRRIRRTTLGQFDSLLWRLKRQWHRWFPE
jgi:hypothetical protein